jgi:uncharacterized protein (DUF58 family)
MPETAQASILNARQRDQVARLQFYARSVVDGITVGKHRSPHKGFSAEFKEHRPYVAGDEIRSIDWKLFGKTDRLFIRQYEEETNLRCNILLDQSKSMQYGADESDSSKDTSKHAFALKIAASLAYLFVAQQDSVGLGLMDTTLRKYIPPRSRPSHLQAIIEELAQSQCNGETSLASVLQSAAPRVRGRGVLVLITDAFDDVDSFVKALSFYRIARSEVILFHVMHRDEIEFPFRQRTEFRNLEVADNKQLVDPAAIRSRYLERVQKFLAQLQSGCLKNQIDYVPCITDQEPGDLLSEYLVSRGRRR